MALPTRLKAVLTQNVVVVREITPSLFGFNFIVRYINNESVVYINL